MLAEKRSAGVAPEVNLRNSLHTSDEGSTLALKPRTDVARIPKVHKMDLRHPKIKKTGFLKEKPKYCSERH